MRTVVGSMDLDQLLSHRDEINEIKDIVPPKDLVDVPAGAKARMVAVENRSLLRVKLADQPDASPSAPA